MDTKISIVDDKILITTIIDNEYYEGVIPDDLIEMFNGNLKHCESYLGKKTITINTSGKIAIINTGPFEIPINLQKVTNSDDLCLCDIVSMINEYKHNNVVEYNWGNTIKINFVNNNSIMHDEIPDKDKLLKIYNNMLKSTSNKYRYYNHYTIKYNINDDRLYIYNGDDIYVCKHDKYFMGIKCEFPCVCSDIINIKYFDKNGELKDGKLIYCNGTLISNEFYVDMAQDECRLTLK